MLYNEQEFEDIKCLYKKYKYFKEILPEYENNSSIYFTLNFILNDLQNELLKKIKQKCLTCQETLSFGEFIDSSNYYNEICCECRKCSFNFDNEINQYFCGL